MYILAERLAGLVSTRVVCVSEYDRKKGMALKLVDAAKMEGLPLTIIEAMLAGVPVVASDAGGVGEMVAHGETGYLVSEPDIGSAAKYIKELVDNTELRAKMGLAGRSRALEMFSLGGMINRYEQLYLGNLEDRLMGASD
jgi:glycosyltransferase involved in cell wall biosynthesis